MPYSVPLEQDFPVIGSSVTPNLGEQIKPRNHTSRNAAISENFSSSEAFRRTIGMQFLN